MWDSFFHELDAILKVAFPTRAAREKIEQRVDYHFSPRAGSDRWDKFLKGVRSQDFVNAISRHPDADAKLLIHAQQMHDLSRGRTVAKVFSSRLPGRSYEIKELRTGIPGCTCPDWRFKGSVDPGYECKHIKAFRAGQTKAA